MKCLEKCLAHRKYYLVSVKYVSERKKIALNYYGAKRILIKPDFGVAIMLLYIMYGMKNLVPLKYCQALRKSKYHHGLAEERQDSGNKAPEVSCGLEAATQGPSNIRDRICSYGKNEYSL